jgi:hypothetical protein
MSKHIYLMDGSRIIQPPRQITPPVVKTRTINLECIPCGALKSVKRLASEAVGKHAPYPCSCVLEGEKSLHKTSVAA